MKQKISVITPDIWSGKPNSAVRCPVQRAISRTFGFVTLDVYSGWWHNVRVSAGSDKHLFVELPSSDGVKRPEYPLHPFVAARIRHYDFTGELEVNEEDIVNALQAQAKILAPQ